MDTPIHIGGIPVEFNWTEIGNWYGYSGSV